MEKLIKAQQDGVVIGLKEVSGVQPREDIDTLVLNNPNVLNLYLLALQEIQTEQQGQIQDKMGYFQIAGIHGLPKKNWDGIQGPPRPSPRPNDPPPPPPVGGYCAHGYNLFPTWHRPYLAMMEQSLYVKVQQIAGKYTDPAVRAVYQEAAKNFRLPYWDYFRPRGGKVHFPGVIDGGKDTSYPYDFSMPRVLTEEWVMVRTTPNNELVKVKNPLSTYSFPREQSKTIPDAEWDLLFKSKVSGQTFKYSKRNTTRYPEEVKIQVDDKVPDLSNTAKMNKALNKDRAPKIITFLTFLGNLYNDYSQFSSDGIRVRDPNTGKEIYHSSLEAVHGDYHGTIGGLSASEEMMGHMGRVPVAAFDPVFWLHHCNIDRMLAIYMATHPNSWLPQTKIPQGSPTAQFPEEMGLYPFRKKARVGATDKPENFWNSIESKTGDKFGYSYPYVDFSKSAEDIKATFQKFYSWSLRDDGTPPTEMQPLALTKAQVFDYDKKGSFTEGAAPTNFVLSSLQSGISALTNTVQAPLQQAPQPSLNAAYATDDTDKAIRQWYIDTSVLRHSQNGAFTLFFFIGESNRINNNTEDYLIKPTLAGLSHVFVAPTEACDNCAQQLEAGARAIDSTPINPILLDYIKIEQLQSLEPEHVKPFLIKNLRWRVVTINQDRVDPGDQSLGLEISVSASVYQPPPNDEVPGYETYPEITQTIIQQAGT